MTKTFARTDTSTVGRWWWTVDKWMLTAVFILIAMGILLNLAAGPPAADRIGAETYHFVRRQLMFLPIAALTMFAVSLLPALWIRRVSTIGFVCALALLLVTLLTGNEVNGARRWLQLGPFSFQPSEFIKPFFIVIAAWMFTEYRLKENFPGSSIALGLLVLVVALLLSQPDVGMTLVVVAVWCAQFFVAGLPMFWVISISVLGLCGLIGAYFVFSHVASRVDRFLDPSSGDTYQISQAMRAFQNGGLVGRGPGEGRIKEALPDAHTDFIFAVAGEEFGVLLCLAMVAVFTFIVLRAIVKALQDESLFVLLAVGGLSIQFGLQAVINMASSLHMMPTKGMTLPFISYGGSSIVSLAIGMGMILALTRKQRNTARLI